MHVGDHVVERVDALEDDDLVGVQAKGFAGLQHAHLAGKFVLGDIDALAPAQQIEVAVQQLHVQAQRRFQIHLALRRAGHRVRRDGLEIVVHRHIVGAHAAAVQLVGDLHGGGRFSAAGGAGEQHDGAALQVADDPLRSRSDLGVVGRVALLKEALRVRDRAVVDVCEKIAHDLSP